MGLSIDELRVRGKSVDKESEKQMKMIERLLREMRASISPNIPVQMVHTLVVVALNEGKCLTEITKLTAGKVSTTSRHLLDLGIRNRKKEPGYGLINCETDAVELRKNNYFLTTRGKLLMRQLAITLEG